MKLVFRGARGYTESRTRRHRMHSSLSVSYYDTRVLVDYGADWLDADVPEDVAAILVTHAHPDHAGGLQNGVPRPVYATPDAWKIMADFAIEQRRSVAVRRPFNIGGLRFEAFPLEHSARAPAAGYRITANRSVIFYAPDVVHIRDRGTAMGGADIYVGDGATLTTPRVRKIGDRLVGHAPVRTQLTWRRKENVKRAVFTHCGSEIVAGDGRAVRSKIESMAKERNVAARIAYDGMTVILR